MIRIIIIIIIIIMWIINIEIKKEIIIIIIVIEHTINNMYIQFPLATNHQQSYQLIYY